MSGGIHSLLEPGSTKPGQQIREADNESLRSIQNTETFVSNAPPTILKILLSQYHLFAFFFIAALFLTPPPNYSYILHVFLPRLISKLSLFLRAPSQIPLCGYKNTPNIAFAHAREPVTLNDFKMSTYGRRVSAKSPPPPPPSPLFLSSPLPPLIPNLVRHYTLLCSCLYSSLSFITTPPIPHFFSFTECTLKKHSSTSPGAPSDLELKSSDDQNCFCRSSKRC